MLVAEADDRAEDGQLVGDLGDLGEQLADGDPGDGGGDRLELAADLGRRVGLEVEGVRSRSGSARPPIARPPILRNERRETPSQNRPRGPSRFSIAPISLTPLREARRRFTRC